MRELDFSGLGWTDVDDLADALTAMADAADGEERACKTLEYLWPRL